MSRRRGPDHAPRARYDLLQGEQGGPYRDDFARTWAERQARIERLQAAIAAELARLGPEHFAPRRHD